MSITRPPFHRLFIFWSLALHPLASTATELDESCDQYQVKLDKIIEISKKKLSTMEEKFFSYQELPTVIEDQTLANGLDNVLDKLDCMQKFLPEAKVDCRETQRCFNENNDGDKHFTIGHVNFLRAPIHLCQRYWRHKQATQVSMFIHELSHTCGTLDLEYLKQTKKVKTYPRPEYPPFFLFPMNADNYEYWAAKGACLPGFDCPLSTREWHGLKDVWPWN